jgi:hypothetical protein
MPDPLAASEFMISPSGIRLRELQPLCLDLIDPLLDNPKITLSASTICAFTSES